MARPLLRSQVLDLERSSQVADDLPRSLIVLSLPFGKGRTRCPAGIWIPGPDVLGIDLEYSHAIGRDHIPIEWSPGRSGAIDRDLGSRNQEMPRMIVHQTVEVEASSYRR